MHNRLNLFLCLRRILSRLLDVLYAALRSLSIRSYAASYGVCEPWRAAAYTAVLLPLQGAKFDSSLTMTIPCVSSRVPKTGPNLPDIVTIQDLRAATQAMTMYAPVQI